MTLAGLGGVAFALSRDRATLIDWTVDQTTLRSLFFAGLAWALVCSVAAADAAVAARPSVFVRPGSRVLGGLFTVAVMLVAMLPGLAGGWLALRQDALLDTVFAGASTATVARPSSLEDLGLASTLEPSTTAATTTAATRTSASTISRSTTIAPAPPTTATPPAPPAGRWNIALLGGDAGPYRWGMRTDTMIVVSIDRQTGDLASISVPRNLRRLPLPPGALRQSFPRGFDDLANALYTYVSIRPGLGLDPAQVVKGALAELLGIPIDHYILVDMTGFVKIIDALGGVTVNLSKRVPLIPNMDRKTREAPFAGPGVVDMNGAMALSFVRTRETDSDYGRMQRQRCLLSSLASTTSPADLATSYLGLASAVEGAFRSDIPRERLGELVQLFAKVDLDRARGLVLIPPVVNPGRPDVARIRSLVATLLDERAATAEPAVSRPTC